MQRLIGVVFVLMGLGCFVLAPLSTVDCERREGDVACTLASRPLGLFAIQEIRVRGLLAVRIESSQSEHKDTRKPGYVSVASYQMVLVGREGEQRPRFFSSRDSSRLEALADPIERVRSPGR